MATHQFETREGHAYEIKAPDHVPPDEVYAIASNFLGAHPVPVSSRHMDHDPAAPHAASALTPAAEATPPPAVEPTTEPARQGPPPTAEVYLPEPDYPDRWPNSLTAALHDPRTPVNRLHGPAPSLLADPEPLHRPQYGDIRGMSTLPGTWVPNQGIRRPLLEMPVEVRKKLHFDDPQLDAYARVVEVRHNLTPELLVSIKNRGERTESWRNGGNGAVGVMQVIGDNQEKIGLPGEDPRDPVTSMDQEGRLFAQDFAGHNDFKTVRGQIAAHNGIRREGRLVEDAHTTPNTLTQTYLRKGKIRPVLNNTTRDFMERVLDDLAWKKQHEADQHLYPEISPAPPKLYGLMRVPYRLNTTLPSEK